jgi:hypothetical protein
MRELNNRTREAKCILRMLIWIRAEIAFGLNCDEAAEMLAKAIEVIGAHFPEARAEIIDCITDDPFLAQLFADPILWRKRVKT